MYSQFRVDDCDTHKALDIIKRYETKYSARYLIVQEEGKQTGKPHLQGWVCHTAPDNTYRQALSRHYKDLGTHGKCFTKVKDFNVYSSYIINNDNKTRVSYSDVLTNYTETEFNELQSANRFVIPIKSKGTIHDQALQAMKDECVVEGIIHYYELPEVYLQYAPKRLNARIFHDNLTGLTLRLEQLYPVNRRMHNAIMTQFHEVDKFSGNVFSTI